MRNWFIKLFSVLVILMIAVPVTFVALNAGDATLRSEVVAILAKHPQFTDAERRAFFYVLGLHAGDATDPEQKGATLWESRRTPGFWEAFKDADPWRIQFRGCPENRCDVAALEKVPDLERDLETNHQVLQSYVHLIEYAAGGDLFESRADAAYSPLTLLSINLHRLFLLQLADWSRKGGQARVVDLITDSNLRLQGFYKSGGLLEHTLAVAMLHANLEFLLNERVRNPKLRLTSELFASMQIPDAHDLLFDAAEDELRTTQAALESQKVGTPLSVRLALKPNEALNHFYEIVWQSLSTECPGDDPVACYPALRWAQLKSPSDYLINPVGRGLVWAASYNFVAPQNKRRILTHIAQIAKLHGQLSLNR